MKDKYNWFGYALLTLQLLIVVGSIIILFTCVLS